MKGVLVPLALGLSFGAHAATGLSAIRYVPDITVSLNGTVAGPNAVANDSLSGAPTMALAGLPGNVAAYHYTGSVHWLVFDTTVSLPGVGTVTPRDVVSYNGTSYAMVFAGGSHELPDGVAIDALSSSNGTDLLLSLDTTVTLGALTVSPADVIQYHGGWGGSKYFDGGAVSSGANLDALHRLSNGHLLMSFDVAGTVGGVPFGAGDVLEYTPGTPGSWELAYSPSAVDPGWGAANLHGLWAQEALLAPGTLQFSAPTYSVNEAGGTATITVTRTGGATGPVAVSYTTADGSATAGADYTPASGTLSWASGDTTAKTFAIAITNDAVVEGAEAVLLSLMNPTGGASLGAANATLTITDDDLPAGTPMAAVNPPVLGFGNQPLGIASAGQDVTVTNTGTAALTSLVVSISGTDAGDFAVLADNCTGSTLAPLASCTITVSFTAGQAGPRAATLSIASNATNSPNAVPLSGTGVAAAVAGLTPVPTLDQWAQLLLGILLSAATLILRKETK